MDIKKEILKEYSKPQVVKVANYIADDKERFAELLDLMLDQEYRISQRAAWVMSHCVDTHQHLIIPHLKKVISNLRGPIPVAVTRNTLRILQFIEIPTDLLGEIADIGFKIMESGNQPIAVKVFAMTVLANICEQEPELKNELVILIEDQMPYGSAGFKNRGGKILKKLRSLA